MMMQHVSPRSPVRVSTDPNNEGETSSYRPVRRGRGMTSSSANRVRIDRNGSVVRGTEAKRSALRVRSGEGNRSVVAVRVHDEDPPIPCSEHLIGFTLFLVLFWIAVWFSLY